MANTSNSSTLSNATRYSRIASMQRAHVEWVMSAPVNVFGTLKFCKTFDYERPPTLQVLRTASRFWNKMDRLYYGNSVEKGVRIPRQCFLHMGSSQVNPHLHFVADVDGDCDLFCKLAALHWSLESNKTTSPADTIIEPVRDAVGSTIYMAREEFKMSGDSYQPALSHRRNDAHLRKPIDIATLNKRLNLKLIQASR